MGRVEWLRAAGLSYKEMEAKGHGFVVVEALVRYLKAAHFDDELAIRTTLADVGRAAVVFEYAALRGGEAVATGRTRHAYVDLATGKARRVPGWFSTLASGPA